MKVIEDKNNILLNRKEVKIIIESSKNPSIAEANEKIAEHFKADKEGIAVKNIKGKFGRSTFLITANIYNNKDTKEAVEPKKKEKKENKAPVKEEKKEA